MYLLVRKNNKFRSDSILELIGFDTVIEQINIIIYKQQLIDKIIKEKLLPDYNRLVKKVLVFLEEDPDSDNAQYLLDETARLYGIYLNKYQKFLSNSENDIFMKNIRLIANELKQLSYKKIKQNTQEISMGRRR